MRLRLFAPRLQFNSLVDSRRTQVAERAILQPFAPPVLHSLIQLWLCRLVRQIIGWRQHRQGRLALKMTGIPGHKADGCRRLLSQV